MRSKALSLSLLLLLSPLAIAAPIYKWVDANGVTHFDAQPPADQKATEVGSSKANSASSSTVDDDASDTGPDQATIDRKVKLEIAGQEAKIKEYCETARTNVAQLKNNPRVRMEINGENRRLTDEERKGKITEIEEQIKEQCK